MRLSILCGTLATLSPLYGQPSSEFTESLQSIAYEDRPGLISSVLQAGPDPETGILAIHELVRACEELNRRDEGLSTLGDVLSTSVTDTALYREAFYARARLLYGSGQELSAIALFRQGDGNGWQAAVPLTSFLGTLFDLDPKAYAVESFNRAISDPLFYKSKGDHLRILCVERLWPKRVRDPTYLATTEVFPMLSTADQYHHDVARAICLIIDGEHELALTQLRALQFSVVPPAADSEDTDLATFFSTNEILNIPLYLAAAALLSPDRPPALPAMEEFHRLNATRPRYVAEALLRIAWTLEHGPAEVRDRRHEVTDYLIANGFTGSDSPLTTDLRRHILSMDMFAHLEKREWDKGEKLAHEILEDYDAENTSCNNALRMLAFLLNEQQRLDEAESVLLRMLRDAQGSPWKRIAKSQLLVVRMKRNDPLGSFVGIAEGLESAPPSESRIYGYQQILASLEHYSLQENK